MADLHSSSSTDDPQAALDQTLGLLRAHDDTSKFVGLSLLRSLLDSNARFRTNTDVILRCWNAISNKFLVRLLTSHSTKKKGVEEVKSMVQLALAVVHLFANLLPPSETAQEKMTEFCAPLVHAIPRLDAEPQALAFQTLQCIASSPTGAKALSSVQDWNPLLEAAKENPEQYLKQVARLFAVSQQSCKMTEYTLDEWHSRLEVFIRLLHEKDKSALIVVLAELAAEFSSLSPPEWPPDAVSLLPAIRTVILKRPITRTRYAVVTLVAKLLRGSTANVKFPDLLFRSTDNQQGDPSRPFAYIFINLLLIDIRSTIPSLMEMLASQSYSTTAIRLADSYDILCSFIMYLLENLGPDTDFTDDSQPAILPPDLLLKLRRDFSETFSLTLEFFRDRWEATVTGASGLDPSARLDPNAPLTLTWDNPSLSPAGDPIVLAGLRALSLWLREDDNPQLHEQAVGNMDMFIPLYSASMLPDAKADFRHPIITAFSGIFPGSDDAVQAFLNHKGWPVLADDLVQCYRSLGGQKANCYPPTHMQDLIRVLIVVVESSAVPQSQQLWMETVRMMAKSSTPDVNDVETLETVVGGWHLAVSILSKAPKRLQRTFSGDARMIKGLAQRVLDKIGVAMGDGLGDSLIEIVEALEELE